ncbi:MAG: UDP-3-O-(3-hydroxymyristoyl)glucosamine N-acyltransferase, partial [Phycisphaerae bacterium]|nr:UDP-3-O-(3-hydroxymyristoyl)glucosamine N-acyltransferase [Phycisphaerae bacterium]
GTKFSNLIAIGHGSKIGEDCMFVAQVGLAGSVTVGKHVTVAGQAGVVGHISIGDNARIGAKAGVTVSVPPGAEVLGAPARPIQEARRMLAIMGRLPEMRERLRELEAEVQRLRERLDSGE